MPLCETHVLDYLFSFRLKPVLPDADEPSAYRGLGKINRLDTEIQVSVGSRWVNAAAGDFVVICETARSP